MYAACRVWVRCWILRIQRRDGSVAEVPVTCRLDTAEELSALCGRQACCSVLRKRCLRPPQAPRNAFDISGVLLLFTA